jgi:hypothetical protein
MNRDEIIRMAREACDPDKVDAWKNGFWTLTQEELERFAALVAKAEREACAKLCEDLHDCEPELRPDDCATAIRGRTE